MCVDNRLWIFILQGDSNLGIGAGHLASALRTFLESGGISHIFPGDSSRDTSVQFELISEVTGTTTVGRPISVTLRNAPTSRMPYMH